MGFFSNIGAIQRINTLLKTIEPKVTAIQNECNRSYPNKEKIQIEARTICVLMSEIMDIADSSGESVRSVSYFFFGEKTNLIHISMVLTNLIEMCENL